MNNKILSVVNYLREANKELFLIEQKKSVGILCRIEEKTSLRTIFNNYKIEFFSDTNSLINTTAQTYIDVINLNLTQMNISNYLDNFFKNKNMSNAIIHIFISKDSKVNPLEITNKYNFSYLNYTFRALDYLNDDSDFFIMRITKKLPFVFLFMSAPLSGKSIASRQFGTSIPVCSSDEIYSKILDYKVESNSLILEAIKLGKEERNNGVATLQICSQDLIEIFLRKYTPIADKKTFVLDMWVPRDYRLNVVEFFEKVSFKPIVCDFGQDIRALQENTPGDFKNYKKSQIYSFFRKLKIKI